LDFLSTLIRFEISIYLIQDYILCVRSCAPVRGHPPIKQDSLIRIIGVGKKLATPTCCFGTTSSRPDDDSTLLPARIDASTSSFYSRTFFVRFQNQRDSLHSACLFSLDIPFRTDELVCSSHRHTQTAFFLSSGPGRPALHVDCGTIVLPNSRRVCVAMCSRFLFELCCFHLQATYPASPRCGRAARADHHITWSAPPTPPPPACYNASRVSLRIDSAFLLSKRSLLLRAVPV